MKKSIAVITSVLSMLLILFVCTASAQGLRKQIREFEKMTTGQQSGPQTSKAASSLPMKGIGCWVQKTSMDNPYIYSDVFGWYVVDISIIDSFNNKSNKPLFLSYTKQDADFLIEKMKQYKGKIVGVIWDYEIKDTPQNVAERDLKKAYSQAKALNLSFGVFVWANPKNSLKVNGISYENASSFADFLMPMLYAQLYDMRREKLEKLISTERAATRLPLIATLTVETTRKSLRKTITPEEIVSIYKNLPIDGFCVWNVKDLNEEHVKALSAIRK
jgi:hypothetical protein